MTAATYNPTSPLDRIEGETSRAHAALVAYANLGPDRSLEKCRQSIGKTRAGYVTVLEGWSRTYHWQERVNAYDTLLAQQALEEAADDYKARMIEHQRRYDDAGQALYGVALELLESFRAELREGNIALTPAALTAIMRALETANALEAHALSLDRLLPMLEAEQ